MNLASLSVDPPDLPPAIAEAPAPRFQVHAWPLPLRLFCMALLTVCAANLVFLTVLSGMEVLSGISMAPPGLLVRWLVVYSLVPVLLVWGARWLTRATVLVEQERLVLVGRGEHFEIPLESIERIRPWRLPVPGVGLTLRMKSGRAFRYGLQGAQPVQLLEAIGQRDALGTRALEHPLVHYAEARHALMLRRWYHLGFKYVVFPLLPAVIVFRLHQFIVFGGPFGEYQLYGLERYLKSFFGYWSTTVGHLVLYASVWRVLAEALALGVTWRSPPHARSVRRWVEIACRVAFYGGIPTLILVRIFWV